MRQGLWRTLDRGEFRRAAEIAAYSYSSKPIADDFSIALVATAEAVKLGRDSGWTRRTEDLAAEGLSVAQKKLDSSVNKARRQTILEAIAKSVELSRKEESQRE